MLKWYSDLQATTSTNDKVEILRQYDKDPVVREVIRLCYEPFIHSYLQNIPKPKTSGSLVFRSAFPTFAKLFDDLNERRLTGNAARAAVQSFLESVEPNAQTLFINVLKKDLRAGIGEKLVMRAFGDEFINYFEVQLGEPYNPERTYRVGDRKSDDLRFWWISRKLNGIRGFQEGTDVLRTRNGNKIHGFDYILEELAHLKQRFGLRFEDGELFDHGIKFQTIMSYVSKEKNIIPEHKEKIKFHVFAVGFEQEWHDTAEMVKFMRQIPWDEYKYIKEVHYDTVKNVPDSIYMKMSEYFDDGFEGAMLRHPYRCWAKGRSHDIVKVKPVLEGDFRIVGYEMGKPGKKWANTLGALIVEGEYTLITKDKKTGKKIETTYPIRSNVGSGYKEKEEEGVTRDQILREWDQWEDSIIEVHFQMVTDKPDPATGKYSLQFPRFHVKKVDKVL